MTARIASIERSPALHLSLQAALKRVIVERKLRPGDALPTEAALARQLGLRVNAGHGLTYQNVEPVAALPGLEELNIGHTIVARALAVGLSQAVREMRSLIQNPRRDALCGGPADGVTLSS